MVGELELVDEVGVDWLVVEVVVGAGEGAGRGDGGKVKTGSKGEFPSGTGEGGGLGEGGNI